MPIPVENSGDGSGGAAIGGAQVRPAEATASGPRATRRTREAQAAAAAKAKKEEEWQANCVANGRGWLFAPRSLWVLDIKNGFRMMLIRFVTWPMFNHFILAVINVTCSIALYSNLGAGAQAGGAVAPIKRLGSEEQAA